MPIRSDAELARLVPWARSEDVCLRQIALSAIGKKIRIDFTQLTTRSADAEQDEFHAILVDLRRYLESRHVAYEAKVFDGAMLTAGESKRGEYFFWPVTCDVVRVRLTNDPWQKLRRAAAS